MFSYALSPTTGFSGNGPNVVIVAGIGLKGANIGADDGSRFDEEVGCIVVVVGDSENGAAITGSERVADAGAVVEGATLVGHGVPAAGWIEEAGGVTAVGLGDGRTVVGDGVGTGVRLWERTIESETYRGETVGRTSQTMHNIPRPTYR